MLKPTLELLRVLYKEKRRQIYNDPSSTEEQKRFSDNMCRIFEDEIAVRSISDAELAVWICQLGFDNDEACDMALKVEKEVRTYPNDWKSPSAEKPMLERVRTLIKEKSEQIYNDPSSDEDQKRFIDKSIEIFDNEDAVYMLSTPQLTAVIRWLRIERPKAREMALAIEEEVRRKYHLIDPDIFTVK